MRFQRLRLSGFKSFVEPTEFRIEAGLTGIVGPNGCGKSNLLEAMRWVMGANSAKAMRAEGMDDVIFGGSDRRPARNHAEVLLQIDNTERRAPARFNDAAVIEVVRRIDRGSGSTYRVNGVETRARDVQMLFADASTGANSPALVRQGQISELIAAKPSNRRRILEEAAGVSGLHSRRHEATLRLNAAEANLARLDDVAGEIESALNRLKREARKAEAYKRLAAEIRALQGAALYARWAEAAAGLAEAETALAAADLAVADTARAAAEATAFALRAGESLKPLREEEMVAAAVLQRLALERDRLARETALAEAEVARLQGEIARNAADRTREDQTAADAKGMLDRVSQELAQLARTIEQSPERTPELERAVATAGTRRAEADAAVERLAAEAAGQAARRQAALDRVTQARAAQKSADGRRSEAEARVMRLRSSLDASQRDAESLSNRADPEAAKARLALDEALAKLTAAREALAAADAERTEAAKAETLARDAARKSDDDLRRLKSEAQGLVQLASAAVGKSAYPPALDKVTAPAGLERAVAAAFGEELDAALDVRASAYWGGRDGVEAPTWPEGVTPLPDKVKGPLELAARLAWIGLVDRALGPKLQRTLETGEALVSVEGDLWRWDGFTVTAEAPKPAAKRLEQKARLVEVERRVAELQPAAAQAAAAHKTAADRLRAAETVLGQARRGPELAERAVATARDANERHTREAARVEARLQALAETLERLKADLSEAETALVAARQEAERAQAGVVEAEAQTPASDDAGAAARIAEARRTSAAAREAEARARSDLEAEKRAREGRLRRREALQRDQADWTRRAESGSKRIGELEAERAKLSAALVAAREAPQALGAEQAALLDQLAAAEARRSAAGDALAKAETQATTGDRDARAADQASSSAREARAATGARLDAAREKLADAAEQLRETTQLEPQALAERIAAEAFAIPTDPGGLESHLRALERERDAMGAVNLRADEEAQEQAARLNELRTERADLSDAIATLRAGIETLNAEGRERLLAAFQEIAESFKVLFNALFEGGQAELRLAESDDPLEAGLEIYACPPGKRLAAMSLMSGGEQALTATALIFAVFLANPAPVCVLDEVDAPLDDANVDRFCKLLDEMRRRTETRFIAITHNPVTMSRMDRLFGVTMAERGVSQLVSVDLRQAEELVA